MRTLKLIGMVLTLIVLGTCFPSCEEENDGINKDNSGGTDNKTTEAYITLSKTTLSLSKVGSTVSVTVESNYSWDYSYNTSNGWFTIEKDEKGSALTINYDTNDTENDRESVVTITAGDGADNTATAELQITQSWENFDALILEYTITSNNTKIELPISGVSSVIIDWDDGNTETVSSNYPSHTYSTPGIYTITINGNATRLNSTETNSHSTTRSGVKHLTAVKQWGNTNLTSMLYAFRGCNNLTSLPDDYVGAFKNVTTFEEAFYDCTALVSVPENMFSNCTAVTTFKYCFYNCPSLTSAPSFEGCSAATSFYVCFKGCSSLTSIPENIFSNCPNVTSFGSCFNGCSSLTSIPENIFSNCPNVTDFAYCFYECSSLTSIPENIFSNCSNVTDFARCFYECSSLTSIPKNIFSNCSNVTDFAYCFYECSSLTSIPENIFSGCPEANEFSCCFSKCSSLTAIPENIFSNCSNVTNFYCCFYGCSLLTSIPENIFSNCPNVTSFGSCFDGCSSLTSIPENIFSNCPNVTNFSYTFYNCSSVEGESPYTEIEVDGEKVKAHLYERENYAVEMRWAIPTSYYSCFTRSSFSDIDSIPSGWGGNKK